MLYLSEKGDELKKEIDAVLCGDTDTDIKELLQLQYRSDSDKDFIQKYAETQMAFISAQITFVAYLSAALIALIGVAISLILNVDILLVLVGVLVIIVACILFFLFRFNYPKFFSKIYTIKIHILKDIIIAVQDSKLETQESVDKLDECTVDTINKKNIDDYVKIMNNKNQIDQINIKHDLSELISNILKNFTYLLIIVSATLIIAFLIDSIANISNESILIAVTSIYVILNYGNLKKMQVNMDQKKTKMVLDDIEKKLMNVYSPIDTVLKKYKLYLGFYQSGDSKKIPENFDNIFMEMNDEVFKIQKNYGYLFEPDLIQFYNNIWKVWEQYLGSEDVEKMEMLFEKLNGDINVLYNFISNQIEAEKIKKNGIK